MKYQVHLRDEVTVERSVLVEVEADSPEAAQAYALEHADDLADEANEDLWTEQILDNGTPWRVRKVEVAQ
jgi:hypothetical protein